MSAIEELVSYTEGLRYEDLPPSVVETVKRSVLNNLSATMAGSSADVCAKLHNVVKEWGGKPEGTILVYGDKVPLPNAAWVNSAMGRGFDFDDIHEGIGQWGGHVNATIVPGALSISEYSRAFKDNVINGRDLIVAIALGIELTLRLFIAGKLGASGWLVEIGASLGIAALGGKLLGLEREKTLNALGIAYSQCSGNLGASVGEGTGMMPSVQQGLGTKSGVLSVLLADKGFTAAKDILGGRWGLYSLYGHVEHDPEFLLGELGTRYEATKLFTKPHPGCTMTQTTIYGALELARKYNISAEDIDKIILKVSSGAYAVCGEGKSKPSSPVDALWNFPYSTAVALVKGGVFLDDFTEEAIRDQRVLKLLQRVTMEVDPHMSLAGAEIAIKTKDGKSYRETVEYPKGHFMNPMSAAELAQKFRSCNRYSAKPLPDESVESLIQMINKLEEVEDVTKIMSILS